jgi:hypothetical protein
MIGKFNLWTPAVSPDQAPSSLSIIEGISITQSKDFKYFDSFLSPFRSFSRHCRMAQLANVLKQKVQMINNSMLSQSTSFRRQGLSRQQITLLLSARQGMKQILCREWFLKHFEENGIRKREHEVTGEMTISWLKREDTFRIHILAKGKGCSELIGHRSHQIDRTHNLGCTRYPLYVRPRLANPIYRQRSNWWKSSFSLLYPIFSIAGDCPRLSIWIYSEIFMKCDASTWARSPLPGFSWTIIRSDGSRAFDSMRSDSRIPRDWWDRTCQEKSTILTVARYVHRYSISVIHKRLAVVPAIEYSVNGPNLTKVAS